MTPDDKTPRLKTLIIDDEKNIRTTLGICLEGMGCEVLTAATGEAALATLAQVPCDLAFLDIRLGNASGLELLPRLLSECPHLSVVVITAYATIDTAVEAIRKGALDYLPKPFSPAQIRLVVEQMRGRRSLALSRADLSQRLAQEVPEADLGTESPRMRTVYDVLERAAAADASVLLRGESGTGKGVLARALHMRSRRRDHPFVVVNCPTLSDELLVSELFGHIRGAFTGAVRDQVGRVEAAAGGTLFLDEIGEISIGLQARLLRFLQDRQFERLGDNRTRRADVRIVAATNRNLEADVAAGRFREDLLYRLNVLEIRVPPLRDRPEDILPLARKFLAFFAMTAGRPLPSLTPKAETALLAYTWPGNVRQLRNAMERAVILSTSRDIGPEDLPDRVVEEAQAGPRLGGDVTLEALEREHILRVIARTPTLEEAARILGIESSTLWRKRKKLDGHDA